jgi:hypothetical protein
MTVTLTLPPLLEKLTVKDAFGVAPLRSTCRDWPPSSEPLAGTARTPAGNAPVSMLQTTVPPPVFETVSGIGKGDPLHGVSVTGLGVTAS